MVVDRCFLNEEKNPTKSHVRSVNVQSIVRPDTDCESCDTKAVILFSWLLEWLCIFDGNSKWDLHRRKKNICRLIVLAYSHTCGSFRKSVPFTEHSVNKNNNFYHKAEEKDGVNVRSSCLIWQNRVLDGDKLQKWILKIWTLISKEIEQ